MSEAVPKSKITVAELKEILGVKSGKKDELYAKYLENFNKKGRKSSPREEKKEKPSSPKKLSLPVSPKKENFDLKLIPTKEAPYVLRIDYNINEYKFTKDELETIKKTATHSSHIFNLISKKKLDGESQGSQVFIYKKQNQLSTIMMNIGRIFIDPERPNVGPLFFSLEERNFNLDNPESYKVDKSRLYRQEKNLDEIKGRDKEIAASLINNENFLFLPELGGEPYKGGAERLTKRTYLLTGVQEEYAFSFRAYRLWTEA